MTERMIPVLQGGRCTAYAAATLIALALALLPFAVGVFGDSWVRILDFALLYVMLALGLNVVVGYAGLLDLGYVAFYAVGAYLYALLSSPHLTTHFDWIAATFPQGLHAPVWLVVPLSAALAAVFGVLLGAPTLRLRGDYLAVVTLGFGEIVRIFMNNLSSPVNLTNGPQGIDAIDPVRIAGVSLGTRQELLGIAFEPVHLYYYLFLLLTTAVILVTIRLQDSRIGRAWMAIREDEIAAESMGIDTRKLKLLAFGMGASFGGVSGAMFAAFQGFVSPESFSLNESILVVSMVVLGGMGHVPGVILGALLLYAAPEALRHLAKPAQLLVFGHELIPPEALRMLLFGMSMVAIMLYRPQGLWPARTHGRAPERGAGVTMPSAPAGGE
jgi:branched-chain amino acid transport system permease protein